jgi:hypothetical protein
MLAKSIQIHYCIFRKYSRYKWKLVTATGGAYNLQATEVI